MITVVTSISSLLLGIGTLLVGVGFLGTLLGVRAGIEGFSEQVTGLVMSAYFAGYILGTWACPSLIRRVGHIRAFAAMAAVASVCVTAHALWVHPVVWGTLRVISGACLVGLYIVIESWLNVLAPNQKRGKMLSVYMMTTLLAMAGGQYLILVADPATFMPFGIIAMLISLGLVPVALTRVLQPQPVETPAVVGIGQLFRVSPLGVAGAFVTGFVLSAFWGMGAVFAQGIGLDAAGIAAYMSATILGGALLQWPVGHLSDRFDRRGVLTLFCFVAAGLSLAGWFLVDVSTVALLVASFFYGGVAFALYSLSVAHVNDHVSYTEVLEATRGLLLIYGVGAALGPAGAGLLMEMLGARSLLAAIAGVLGLLGLFAVYRMRTGAPIPAAAQGEFVSLVRTTPEAVELLPEAEVEPELDLPAPPPESAVEPEALRPTGTD